MPAESISEQISAAVRTLLAGITGPDYWFDLADQNRSRVVRTSAVDWIDLDQSLDSIILVIPGDETIREKSTGSVADGGGLEGKLELFVFIARKFTPATESPFTEDAPSRWTLINRAIRDVLRKMFFEGVTVGPTATVNISSELLVIDRQQYAKGWALAELRFVVEYETMAANP